MHSWRAPAIPILSEAPKPPTIIFDSATKALQVAASTAAPGSEQVARLYTCGITPYDATHIGHANTYLAFDLLVRAWLDQGYEVAFAQNVTDVDDPLLERAAATGVDWRHLAADQVQLFRDDMEALRVIPPHPWVSVSEAMPEIIAAVEQLLASGAAYRVANEGLDSADIYFDISSDSSFGCVSHLPESEMLALFAERGGDPDRAGKRNQLDPLLWRAHRDGEPAWRSAVLGSGRPGWHIECTVIAADALGPSFDVTGGGADLLFPHHEMSASLARALYGNEAKSPGARRFIHCGLISYEGEKMSKSLGNLVLVSQLTASGVDPMAIRLALLAHHYQDYWEWTDAHLANAQQRLSRWRTELASPPQVPEAPSSSLESVDGRVGAAINQMRAALRDNLDAPRALAVVDEYLQASDRNQAADANMMSVIDALLGIKL